MENTFDIACRILPTLSSEELKKLQGRIADLLLREDGAEISGETESEVDAALEAAGLFASDPLYQPVTEEQLRMELLTAQRACDEGRHMDALEFCRQIEADATAGIKAPQRGKDDGRRSKVRRMGKSAATRQKLPSKS